MDKGGVKGELTQCGPHLLVSAFVDDKEMGTPQLKSEYCSWLIVSLDYTSDYSAALPAPLVIH